MTVSNSRVTVSNSRVISGAGQNTPDDYTWRPRVIKSVENP
jgi:hypothetical protein